MIKTIDNIVHNEDNKKKMPDVFVLTLATDVIMISGINLFRLLCWNIVHVLFLSNKFTWFDISVQNTFVGHCMCKTNNMKYLLTFWIYFNDLLRIQINNLTIMSYVNYYKVLPNIFAVILV